MRSYKGKKSISQNWAIIICLAELYYFLLLFVCSNKKCSNSFIIFQNSVIDINAITHKMVYVLGHYDVK